MKERTRKKRDSRQFRRSHVYWKRQQDAHDKCSWTMEYLRAKGLTPWTGEIVVMTGIHFFTNE